MKKITKIDLIKGKIEFENQPPILQIFVIVFAAFVLIVLALILKEGMQIVYNKMIGSSMASIARIVSVNSPT